MRWSQVLIPTQKQMPADVSSAALGRLARAGLVGVTRRSHSISFLPLGLRTLRKLEGLMRAGLEELGFQEVLIADLSGELPPMDLAASALRSYRHLPAQFFQIINSPTPYVSAFGFHADGVSLRQASDRFEGVITDILSRCRLKPIRVNSSDGRLIAMPATGGETPGDTSILISPTGDYAATMEAAECAPRSGNFAGESIADLQKVSTPGLKTVTEVCQFLKLSSREILKTLVFVAQSPIAIRWVVAVVRGDHQVNIGKLGEAAAAMGVTSIRLADPRETAGKWSMGFVGPDAAMKLPDAVLIVDPDAAQGGVAWSAGGNEPDTHVIGFNWFRECGDRLADPVKVSIADIRNAVEGDMAWTLTGALHGGRVDLLAEIKHLSPSPDFTFDDAAGKARSFHYGVYRIDLLNTLLDIAGSSHDERGLAWPVLVAPCRVVIIPIQYEGEVRKAADGIVQQLDAAGIDAILDDRDLRAGAKFADADLVGFPVRVTIGSRTLQNGEAEIKVRCTQQAQQVALGEVAETVVELLKLP